MSNNVVPPVKVQLAISKEQTKSNIEGNLKLIPNWFGSMFYPNGYESYVISAGPSMEKYVEELNLKERMTHPNRSFIVLCVKHALPRLLEMGIEPDFCVILDGRPLDADSTHGVNRKGLFKKIPEKTIFLLASMSSPDYAKYLTEQGARILGWHTEVDGLRDYPISEPIINGGTSSGTRSIAIAHALGCRTINLVGFDSCIHEPTPEQLKELDKKGRPQYIHTDLPVQNYQFTPEQQALMEQLRVSFQHTGETSIGFKGEVVKRFYTTGELLAQSQDFEQIFKNPMYDIQFKVFDDGIVNHLFNNIPKHTRGFNFVNYFKSVVPKKDHSSIPKRKVTF